MRRLLALLFLAACGPTLEPQPPQKPEPVVDAGVAKLECPVKLDVADVLKRHTTLFGTPEQALASMPMSLHGTVDRPGLPGTFEIIRTAKARRIAMWVDGIFRSSGYDEQGSWTQGTHGAVIRLKPGEAREHNAWIEQRRYVLEYDAKKTQSRCDVMEGRPLVRVMFDLPDQGNPLVVFDNESAELVASAMNDVDGSQTLWRYNKWAPPDAHGVRWPIEEEELGEAGAEARLVVTKTESGLVCPPLNAAAPVSADCLQPHAARVAYDFGATKRGRAAMKDDLDIVTFTLKSGTKEVPALFDPTEAFVAVVDEPEGAKASFTSTKHFSIDKMNFDIGTIDLALGGLTVKHAPGLMRSIGNVDTIGSERPMIITGAGVTVGLAVRVDHVKKEIVFAPSGEPLAAKTATAIPFKMLGGAEIVLETTIGGAKAQMELGFQSFGAVPGLEIYDTWGNANGIPGTHPTVSLDKNVILMRAPKIELGPLKLENQLAHVQIRELTHAISGRIPVAALLRCNAFTIDAGMRTLWLEGPCDRPMLEDNSGWTLARDTTSTEAPIDRPWKVGLLIKEGSADKAGIKEGDRILEVGGKPATLDRGSFLPILAQKSGTKVDVTLMRAGEKKKLSMTLSKILP